MSMKQKFYAVVGKENNKPVLQIPKYRYEGVPIPYAIYSNKAAAQWDSDATDDTKVIEIDISFKSLNQ